MSIDEYNVAIPTLNPGASTRELGHWGEDVAAAYLEHRGYRILARNWRIRAGELDIVALDSAGALVGVEVKTRRAGGQVPAWEAITATKARRLRRLLAAWCAEYEAHTPSVRLDLIAITVMRDRTFSLEHREAIQ